MCLSFHPYQECVFIVSRHIIFIHQRQARSAVSVSLLFTVNNLYGSFQSSKFPSTLEEEESAKREKETD